MNRDRTKSEEILEMQRAARKVEHVTDKYGRALGVMRLKPSQQLMIEEMAPGLSGTTPIVDDGTGEVIDVPRLSPLILAASVVEVDGSPFPFPRNRTELNATLDMLDRFGLEAVGEALGKLAAETISKGTGAEAAKN